jgi:hypothetical protein
MLLAGWSLRSRLSLAFLVLFCVTMLGAMSSYAGGSWLHPQTTSHVFFENFWCDLLREPAHNGLPNGRSVALATLGFVAVAVSLAAFWLEVSRLLGRRRARFVQVAGVVSSLATALVALVPSDRFPGVHPPAVLTSGGLGFVCGCICSAWALSHYKVAPVFALSSLVLVGAAAVNLVLYVRAIYFHASESIAMPLAQKVATLGLLCWVVAGLGAAQSVRPAPGALSAGRPTP